MTKIILASASAQRKKLLQMAGVRFTVRPSHAKEVTRIKTTCADLVKENARLKAENIAASLKEGLVIGADTVVYAPKSGIIGKPRNLKDAKRILKVLFSRPHWVYTGVVVIDAKTQKTLIDCEKTKIYMHKLSDEEIDRYHGLTSPLDKAGGFDIEGRGGLFINRIEGCYSNVIGLPLAKIRVMLKKFGVSILSLVLVVGLAGCASEYNLATEQQETIMYNVDQEVRIGDAVARQIEKNFKVIHDVDVNERAGRIMAKIVAICDRKELVYTIKVLDRDDINAVSLPGGYVYIFKGLYDKLKIDDELAGVIAHEVGHITAKHSIKKLQASYGYLLTQLLAFQTGGRAAQGVGLIYTSVFLAFSRQDEFQADKLGIKYLKKAGYDPKGMIKVLEVLKEAERKAPTREVTYWRTHPYLSERIGLGNQEITGQMDFRGYLNVTGSEE
jgi:septum formation protein